MSDEEGVVRRWVSACVTGGGVLAARQALHARPLLQAQMLEEWLNHYRRLAYVHLAIRIYIMCTGECYPHSIGLSIFVSL